MPKCKHNFTQLLNKKGKPATWKVDDTRYYDLYCTKCGEKESVRA